MDGYFLTADLDTNSEKNPTLAPLNYNWVSLKYSMALVIHSTDNPCPLASLEIAKNLTTAISSKSVPILTWLL